MLNYLKTKDSNERTTPCSNKTEESNSQLLPDSLPENLANADCFKESNESEVPVFHLSRASRAENDGSSPHYRHAENQKNEAVAVENSAIYAKCDDEVITHEMGVTDDYILYSPCTYQTKRF